MEFQSLWSILEKSLAAKFLYNSLFIVKGQKHPHIRQCHLLSKGYSALGSSQVEFVDLGMEISFPLLH